mgnify:CR=1 FL=1
MHEGNPYPHLTESHRQLLQEWFSGYMDARLLETVERTPAGGQDPVSPSDPGYPGAYPLPEVLDAIPDADLSDAEWLEQNRRINLLLRGMA